MKKFTGYLLSFAVVIQMVMFTGCKSRTKSSDLNVEDNNLQGNISISGAFALYPITVRWAEEFQKIHSGVKIDISAGGAGKGMADALSQMVDLGMFSRQVSDQEKEKGAWWIIRHATSSSAAREVERFFIDKKGTDGGPGGGTDDSNQVYAYRKTASTNP